MDFLSIRKKARERAEAKEAAQPGAKPAEEAAPPRPAPEPPSFLAPPEASPPAEPRRTRRPDPVLSEEELLDGKLQERFQGLAPSADGRFATWRPGSGPPPIEPDHRGFAPTGQPRHEQGPSSFDPAFDPALDPGPEPEPEPLPDRPPPLAGPAAREPDRLATAADPLDSFFYRPDEEAAGLPVLGGSSGEEPGPQLPETLDEFLTFRLGQEEFAVAIDSVREVLRAPAITEVPRAPAHVLGVVTVRGEVVAVIDAHGRLGVGGSDAARSRIVIVDSGDGPLGLLVDAVTSVVRLPHGSIEPCPQGIATGATDCVSGIGRHRDRLFMVVDAGALLPGEAA